MTAPDVDSLATYGGAKVDLAPVTDPTTDRPAAGANKAYASTAMMTHTALRAWRSFVGAATTPDVNLPAVNAHDAMWGSGTGVKPAVARTGTGVFTVTWPATVSDELSVSHSTALRRGWAVADSATLYHAVVVISAANVATVRVFDASGVASDAVGATITVFVV